MPSKPYEHTKSSGQSADTGFVDNGWLAALRGYLAGTAGLPGDIEGLARKGLNASFGLGGVKVDEASALPTADFYKEWLPGKQLGDEAIVNLTSMLGGMGLQRPARMLAQLPNSVTRAAGDFARAAGQPATRVIRNTGDNNFLKGSVENALKGLKQDIRGGADRIWADLPPEVIEKYRNASGAYQLVQDLHPKLWEKARQGVQGPVDNWVEGPLTRYVKQQMATPDDPVRALAEQGVLHFDPTADLMRVRDVRTAQGFPVKGVAQNPLAIRWEGHADDALKPTTAEMFQFPEYGRQSQLKVDPWLAKAVPESKVFEVNPFRGLTEDLGFTHLTDELRNALNPESGLPRSLLLTPEKMANMGMERAVRHVAAINDWREQAALTARKAAAEGIPVRKEHEGGFRWLSVPDTAKDEKALKFACDVGKQGAWCTQGSDMAKRYGSEGNQLHVLVDAKGDPHVQIMTSPGDWKRLAPGDIPDPTGEFGSFAELVHAKRIGNGDFNSIANRLAQEHGLEMPPEKIVQIKRKANLVNSDPYEYRPFVQDFVKSGKWSDVGDLANTGLIKIDPTSDLAASLKSVGEVVPAHVTQDELTTLLNRFRKPEYSTGGPVQPFVRIPGFDGKIAQSRPDPANFAGKMAEYGEIPHDIALAMAKTYAPKT